MARRRPRHPDQPPLHRSLATQLRAEILQRYQPGDRIESQNELARRLEVSVLTVREALSALVDEGLIERRQGSGSFVADPAGRQHAAVLIELDIAHPRTSYFYQRLTQQLRRWLGRQGYRPRLYAGHVTPGRQDETDFGEEPTTCPEFLEDLEAGRIRGVAIVGSPGRPIRDELRRRGVPLVGTERDFACRVQLDGRALVELGVEQLVAHGRRQLAFMSWGDPRYFHEVMGRFGLDVRRQWVRCDLPPASPGAGWEEFREIWAAGDEKPDGIVITDDMLFTDAQPAILRLGIAVPDELMVVAHSNRGVDYAEYFPVTRIEADPDAMARQLGTQLAELMEGRTPESAQVTLPWQVMPAGERHRLDDWTPEPENAVTETDDESIRGN